MTSVRATGHTALAISRLLPGFQLLYRLPDDATHTAKVTPDEAEQVLRRGEGPRLYLDVSPENLSAIMEKVAQYQAAYDRLEEDAERAIAKVSGERAQFIQQTVTSLLASWTAFSSSDINAAIDKAVKVALEADRVLWSTLSSEEEG